VLVSRNDRILHGHRFFKDANAPAQIQEMARAGMAAFRRKRRNGRKVGQFGLLGKYYDAFIFVFRARIGIF